MGETPILELRLVRAARTGHTILEEISFEIGEGEACFIMGNAGSGKSALLKTMAGIHIPESGEVLYRGRDLAAMSRAEEREFRRSIGFVFQDAALWSNQSLFENLALPLRAHEPRMGKAEVEKAVLRIVELVGYDEELSARPSELSTGERKLIGLARALILDPEILFMDEPAASLDEEAAGRVRDLIGALKERGRTLAIASSNSESVSLFADRVGVLRTGKLLAYGSYAEASSWTDPALRAVTGRLKPRVASGHKIEELAAAWADALSTDVPEPASAESASAEAAEKEIALGDIINDVSADDEEAGGIGEVRS